MQKEQVAPAKVQVTWLVWLLSFGTLALGMTQQYILGVPDQVAASAQVQLSDVSLMMTAFGVVNAIFAPLVIIATGRFTQRTQLIVGLAFAAAGLFLTAFGRSFAVLLVARGVMGVGNGVFVATAYSVAPKLSKPGHEGTAMANVALGFSAANLLAMPLARALRDFIDWHSAYFALGVVAVALGFASSRCSCRRKPVSRQNGGGERGYGRCSLEFVSAAWKWHRRRGFGRGHQLCTAARPAACGHAYHVACSGGGTRVLCHAASSESLSFRSFQ